MNSSVTCITWGTSIKQSLFPTNYSHMFLAQSCFEHHSLMFLKKLEPQRKVRIIKIWLQHSVWNSVKGATLRRTHLEKTGKFFLVCHSQSVLISLSRNHPCLVLVYYYLFGVFLPKRTIILRFPLMRKQFCQIRKKWMNAQWHSSFKTVSF